KAFLPHRGLFLAKAAAQVTFARLCLAKVAAPSAKSSSRQHQPSADQNRQSIRGQSGVAMQRYKRNDRTDRRAYSAQHSQRDGQPQTLNANARPQLRESPEQSQQQRQKDFVKGQRRIGIAEMRQYGEGQHSRKNNQREEGIEQ